MKMKRVTRTAVLLLMLSIYLTTYLTALASPMALEAYESTELHTDTQQMIQIYRKWYDEVISGFKQDKISKSILEENVIEEYRVVYNVAYLGYDYYSLRVFSDGTGEFHYMVHKSDDFETGEIILNEKKSLDANEVLGLTNVIEANDFFNIPTIHPTELYGLDGTTVLLSWADMFDASSRETKRIIIAALIDRVDVENDYTLSIRFTISAEQFMGEAA